MGTKYENSPNNWYAFQYGEEPLSEVITYRNNLVEAIKSLEKGCTEIQNFSSESMTDEKFEQFVRIAKEANYKIYKLAEQ